MALTNFKISMSEYKRLVEKDAKMAGDGTVYGIFLSNLFNLTNLTEKYFTRDENGNLPILKAEDYKSLIDSYIKLGESCNKFLGEDHPKNKLENKRVHMIKQLSKYIGKDLQGLIKADKEKSTEKIDGAIATIMGLDRAIRCGTDTSASVYDNRGLFII